MDEDTLNELKKLMTSANDDFLEMIALLEALADIMESAYIDSTVIYLTQKLVKKVFKNNCKCKTILRLNG